MAGDSLGERIEAVEQRLRSLQERAQMTPEQQHLLTAAAEDLALALDELRAARDELQSQEQREQLLAQVFSLADVTEQVQARQKRDWLLAEAREQQTEDASRETEATRRLLQTLLEAMPIGVIVADGNGTPVMSNAAAQAILGSPVVGQSTHSEIPYTPYHPDGSPFPPQEMPLVQALYGGRFVRDVEILIRRADGSERTILASAAPVTDEVGEVVSAVTIFQDMTVHRQAEEVLHEERDRLAALVNSIRDEIWYTDAAGRFTLVNPSGSREFALEAETITDVRHLATSLQVLRPDGTARPIEEAPPLRALRGEVVTDEEELVRTPATEELRYRQVSAAPVRDGSDNIIGSVSVVRDVTTLKRAEQERERLLAENRRQRAFLEELIETAPVGLAVVRGPDHRYELANPCYQAIPGIPNVPTMGRTIAEVFSAVVAQGVLAIVEQVYQTGKTVSTHQYKASVGSEREQTYWDVDHVPLRGPDGTVDGVLILANEVTDQVLAHRKVQELAESLAQERDVLQTIMENTPAQLAYFDSQFNFVRVNTAYAEGSGHSREELIGRNHFDLFPNPENQAIFEGVRDVGQPVSYQARPFEYADQPERGVTYWDWTLVPVKSRTGQTQGLVVSLQDVTEQVEARRRIEELAGRSQRQANELRTIFNAMTEGVAVLDPEGKGVHANPAALRLYGVEPSESDWIDELMLPSPQATNHLAMDTDDAMRIRHLSMRHPDGRRMLAEELPSTLSLGGEAVVDQPIYLTNIKGEELVVHASASPLFEGDRISGTVVVLHDVTAREQAERARDRLIDILEMTPDMISTASVNGDLLYCNRAARKILGIPEDGNLSEWVIPQGRPEWANRIIQSQGIPTAIREGMWQGETAVLSHDGREIPVSQVILSHKGADGSVQYLSTIARDVTERRKHQAQLESERARLQAVIDSAPEAIVVVDHEGRIVLANPAAERLYPQPIPYGQSFETHASLALHAPDGTPYDPRQLPLTRSALDGQTSQNVEMNVCWPSGEQRDLLVSSAPIRDTQGSITGAVGVFQDITERRRTQRALERYAERLRILHEIDQAILVARSAEEIAEAALDRVQQLVPCLRVSVLLFDLEKGEASLLAARAVGETQLAKGWRSSIGSEWPIEKLTQGQIHVVGDTQALPESSSLLQALQCEGLRSYVNVPLLAQGTLLGSLNLGMANPGSPSPEEVDIARELAAQVAVGIQQARLHEQVQRHAGELEQRVARRTAALQASQARLQAIFDSAAIGIALADVEGRILESNPALQAMLGYRADELRQMGFTDFTHPEDIAGDRELYQELVAGKRERYGLDKRYVRKDGQVVWARLTMSLVRAREDRAPLAIGMVEDITEQRKVQDALVRTEKLAIAGQLGASLAHEINNPLQSVIGCLGLADKNLAAGADVSRYLRVAREELRRAAGIVAQFRDLHRLSEPEEREPTDLNELLEKVLLLCKKKCEECRIKVNWNGADDLPSVLLVSDRMKQVFLNLILNALDAMPEGGRLEVSTARTPPSDAVPTGVCVSFTDSGSGIAPQVLSHVFEPFYSTKAQGLGLGLYITRNIVEAHGGRIDVKSCLGEGTTFSVWLPAQAAGEVRQ